MPSEKYSLPLSSLRLANANTATDLALISDLDSAEVLAAPDGSVGPRAILTNRGTSYPLRAAFSVIPGQDQRNEETDAKRDDDETHRLFGPAKSLRDNVDALEQRERRRDIAQRPLHQLALLQASKEFIHAASLSHTDPHGPTYSFIVSSS